MIKKILAILMVLLLSTIATASAEAMNKNQNINDDRGIPTETRMVDMGNGIVRYDHVHYAKPIVSFNRFDATVKSQNPFDYKLMGVEWKTAEDFNVYLPDYDVSIIQTSLDTWDTEVEFDVFGDITDKEVFRNTNNDPDGINSVTFEEYELGGIAFARTWYYPDNGTIVESDVVFNSNYAWSDSGEPYQMDLQNIATHEFGHSAGLLDLYNTRKSSENTMYGYSGFGETKKQTLEAGDIAGIHAIYGI